MNGESEIRIIFYDEPKSMEKGFNHMKRTFEKLTILLH